MRITKSQKLADQIAVLKAELSQAKHSETQAAHQEARQAVNRAARKSGLLALVAAGAVTVETLEREFRGLTEQVNGASVEMAGTAPVKINNDGTPAEVARTAGGPTRDPSRSQG